MRAGSRDRHTPRPFPIDFNLAFEDIAIARRDDAPIYREKVTGMFAPLAGRTEYELVRTAQKGERLHGSITPAIDRRVFPDVMPSAWTPSFEEATAFSVLTEDLTQRLVVLTEDFEISHVPRDTGWGRDLMPHLFEKDEK